VSNRYQNAEACGIEPEREGEEPTLEQWRARCQQLWRENRTVRGKLNVAQEALKEISGRCHNRLATIDDII
jgi:hypothetical protein